MAGKFIEPNPESLMRVQKNLGHTFVEKHLLKQALTRAAYSKEKEEDGIRRKNQNAFRVLGDAVLGSIIVNRLIREGLDTGKDITNARQVYENGTMLCEMAFGLEIPMCIYTTSGEKKEEAHKQPRVLAETFEAIIGAIFLDNGRDFRKTEKIVLRWFPRELKTLL